MALSLSEITAPRMWLSGTGVVAGWVNTKVWDETGDAAKAQGWAPFVLDTNGNGKVDEWTEPRQPADADKDTRIAGSGQVDRKGTFSETGAPCLLPCVLA
jgi:hypothetical protein